MTMMRLRREDPRVVGSFRLHRRLGAGGMGVVYLGSDRRGQRVALKVIRPDLAEDEEFRSRFAREVSAARRIRGGCTARLVAADLEADRPWFATQYVPGPSLHDKVADGGPMPAAHVASIGSALAEGLVAVHEAGVVHRDLKPSNILLSPKGPRIIDFGIAWATGASTLTHVGTAVGSPGFLAPEQVRGAAVTPATDVFALGATLAYAATADSPFGQGSSEIMLYRVVHEEPQLRGVPASLVPLLEACLVKTPQDRPSTLQLSLRLKEIAAREGRAAPAPVATEAHGPAGGGERPGGARLAQADRHTQRAGGAPSGSVPASAARDGHDERRGAEPAGAARDGGPQGRGTQGRGTAGRGTAGRGTAGRDVSGRASTARGTTPRPPAQRTGPQRGAGPGPAGRRTAARRRMMRQRLIVFVTVTVLVALGIALAQGCQRDASRGLGPGPGRTSSMTEVPPPAP